MDVSGCFLSKIFATFALSFPINTGILLLVLVLINSASSPTALTSLDSKTSVILLALPL